MSFTNPSITSVQRFPPPPLPTPYPLPQRPTIQNVSNHTRKIHHRPHQRRQIPRPHHFGRPNRILPQRPPPRSLRQPPPALPAVSPVLPTESAADYQTLLNSYLSEFSPIGLLETELVETMAAARWRLRRVSTIETTLLTLEIDRLAEYADRHFKDLHRDPTPEGAWL